MAEPGIPLDKAMLLGIFLETLLYGGFVACYVGTLWMLKARARNDKPHLPMITVMTLMLMTATAHIIVDLIRIMDAFVGATAMSAILYYADLGNPKMVAKTLIFVLQTMLADGFFVYRVYIVWKRNIFIALVPSLSLIGTFVAGIGTVYELMHLTPGEAIFESALVPWITSYFSMTLCTNIISTSLIAGRIWWLGRRVSKYGGGPTVSRGSSAVNIIIESGAVISAAVLGLLISYLENSNGQYPALDILIPLMGIIFCTIIIRVSLGYGFEETTTRGNVSASSWRQAPRTFGGISSHGAGTDLNMHPVTVNVAKYVERDTDVEHGSADGATYRYDADDAKTHI